MEDRIVHFDFVFCVVCSLNMQRQFEFIQKMIKEFPQSVVNDAEEYGGV